jgi:predicted nucleotidyltransferase
MTCMASMSGSSVPSSALVTFQSARALKAGLAARIRTLLERQGPTVREAHAKTGQAAADFSRLRSGTLDRFTIERLLGMVEALGERVTLSFSSEPGEGRGPTMPGALAIPTRALRTLCRRYAVLRLCGFGSVLRDDFDRARSDIDLAVTFAPSRRYGPADQYFRFKAALERLLQREVDLVELSAMPESRLKRSIERNQVPVYEQAARCIPGIGAARPGAGAAVPGR